MEWCPGHAGRRRARSLALHLATAPCNAHPPHWRTHHAQPPFWFALLATHTSPPSPPYRVPRWTTSTSPSAPRCRCLATTSWWSLGCSPPSPTLWRTAAVGAQLACAAHARLRCTWTAALMCPTAQEVNTLPVLLQAKSSWPPPGQRRCWATRRWLCTQMTHGALLCYATFLALRSTAASARSALLCRPGHQSPPPPQVTDSPCPSSLPPCAHRLLCRCPLLSSPPGTPTCTASTSCTPSTGAASPSSVTPSSWTCRSGRVGGGRAQGVGHFSRAFVCAAQQRDC